MFPFIIQNVKTSLNTQWQMTRYLSLLLGTHWQPFYGSDDINQGFNPVNLQGSLIMQTSNMNFLH